VLVEAVKCLCNLVLNNNHLTKTLADLQALHALKGRLALSYAPSMGNPLPHDVLFFDLRLTFLITACGPNERWVGRVSWVNFLMWKFYKDININVARCVISRICVHIIC